MPQFVSPIGLGTPGVTGYGSGSSKPIRAAVGAASSLPLGANLVTNGTFDTNLTGWTNNGNWSWNSGHALHTTGSFSTLTTNVTLSSTSHYMATLVIGGCTTGSMILQITGTNVASGLTNGTYFVPWWSGQVSNSITFVPTTDFNGYVDSVTLQLVSGNATPQLLLDVPENTSAAEFRSDPLMQDVAIGYQAGQTGLLPRGVAIGYQALSGAMVNNDQTAVGYQALGFGVNGDRNTAIGSLAMSNASGGSSNTAVGYRAGRIPADITTGNEGTYIGANTGPKVGSNIQNVAVGASSSAYDNSIAVGYNASAADSLAVVIGNNASVVAGASGGIAIGNSATATAAASVGIAIGYSAKVIASGAIAIGYQAGTATTSGVGNTLVGYQSGKAMTTAANNTTLGYSAGTTVIVGSDNTHVGYKAGNATTGNYSTLLGSQAGAFLSSGSGHTAIGYGSSGNGGASSGQTAVGYLANNTSTANYSTAIGYGALATGAGGVAIGCDSVGGAVTTAVVNEIKLGNANHTVNIPGTLTVAGSAVGGGVAASLFDPNTILKADVDNTPLALTVAASTIVGRGAAGSIAALTAAQTKTILAITPTDVSGFDTQVRTSRLDQMAAPATQLTLAGIQMTDGASIGVGTLSGTMLATAGNNKLGFWGALPVIRDSGWTVGSFTPFRAGISSGLTLSDVANALSTLITVFKGYGLLA